MSASEIALILLAALAALVASVLLAAVRNYASIGAINHLLAGVATPFLILQAFLEWLNERLVGAINGSKKALSHGTDDFTLWDVVGPLIYFVVFLILLGGDAYFAVLTFPELFGVEQPEVNPAVFVPFSAVLWVSIAVALVAAAMDLFGMTRLARPYRDGSDKVRQSLRIAALIALGLLAIAGILFGLFRALLVSLTSIGFVNKSLSVLLFFLIIVASGAAAFSLAYVLPAIGIILVSAARIAASLVGFAISIIVNLLDNLAAFLVGVYDILEHIGHVFWNWLSQVTEGTRWHLGAIPAHEVRPHLTELVKLPKMDLPDSFGPVP